MKKLSFLFLLAPLFVSAVWWNPSTWLKKESVVNSLATTTVEKHLNITNELQTTSSDIDLYRSKIKDLQNQIKSLVEQNSVLLEKLSKYENQAKNNPIKITNTADDEKKTKLASIDKDILPIIDNVLSKASDNWTSGSCSDLYQRSLVWGGSSVAGQEYQKRCTAHSVFDQSISEINRLLNAYRLVDSKMSFANIQINDNLLGLSKNLGELRSYLNEYIKYR